MILTSTERQLRQAVDHGVHCKSLHNDVAVLQRKTKLDEAPAISWSAEDHGEMQSRDSSNRWLFLPSYDPGDKTEFASTKQTKLR